MPKTKILIAFGTRPEAIKMAPLVKALLASNDVDLHVCLTGQHREMLAQVLEIFDIQGDSNLDVMQAGQTLAQLTGKIVAGMDTILEQVNPDRVLVHGDTTTAFAVALSAYYRQIPVGHVEAGLRTGNRYSPWPEEMNRKMVGSLADLHFAPTKRAQANLLAEGVDPASVFVTGNTVIDALLEVRARVKNSDEIGNALLKKYPFLKNDYVLVTGHRRENYGEGFDAICRALSEISQKSGCDIVYPVHLNPQVKGPVEDALGDNPKVHLIDPMDYLDFIWLMDHCRIILTDSGGVQEEAPSLDKPVLVMRDTTERQEAVDEGTVKLVGTDATAIVREALNLLTDASAYSTIAQRQNPFGNGDSADQITKILLEKHA